MIDIVSIVLKKFIVNKKYIKKRISQLKHKESKNATYYRSIFYRRVLGECGFDLKVKSGVTFDYYENIFIGNRVSIQANCFFSAYGGITIGNNVSFGPSVMIFTSHHPYDYGVIR